MADIMRFMTLVIGVLVTCIRQLSSADFIVTVRSEGPVHSTPIGVSTTRDTALPMKRGHDCSGEMEV